MAVDMASELVSCCEKDAGCGAAWCCRAKSRREKASQPVLGFGEAG